MAAILKFKNGSTWTTYSAWASMGTNITGGKAKDTATFWKDQEPGVYWFNQTEQIVGQPSQYGWLVHISSSYKADLITQLWIKLSAQTTSPHIYSRTLSANNSWFGDWQSDGLASYPVGAVYISYTNTSPATQFGGTWIELKGVFPYFNSGTSTGGSNTLSTHTHGSGNLVTCINLGWSGTSGMTYKTVSVPSGVSWTTNCLQNLGSSSTYSVSPGTAIGLAGTTASGGGVSCMPSYQTLYAWRRTA